MIATARLTLRQPERRDFDALAALWADPVVQADLRPVIDRAESEVAYVRHRGYWDRGYGFWVVEREGVFAGFAGLKPGAPGTPIEGEVEAGWMFARPYWGQGLAGEAMRAALDWGWRTIDPARIVAITAARNAASRRLMTRLGMTELPGGRFTHPGYAADDGRRDTVTYTIDRPA